MSRHLARALLAALIIAAPAPAELALAQNPVAAPIPAVAHLPPGGLPALLAPGTSPLNPPALNPPAPTPPGLTPPALTPPTPNPPVLGALPAPAPPAPSLTPEAVEAEARRLHHLLLGDVPHLVTLGLAQQRSLVARVGEALQTADRTIDRPQLIIAVDRNPRVQELSVVLAKPNGAWEILATSHVSTGQAGRFDHYITPTGVFLHTDAILDYRAEGTFNENHIRGYGVKGMRVWDFGWQIAMKGWRPDHQSGPMRLLMHATDPDVLERRIGRPASQGCVRIPAAMNRFLDRFGVLDVDYEQDAKTEIRFRALLSADRTPTPLAGRMMVVIDSSEQA